MRISRRVMVLGVVVGVLGLVLASTAFSRSAIPEPDHGNQISLHQGDQSIDAEEPFYFGGGFGPWENLNSKAFTMHLFQDGVELEPTIVGCVSFADEPSQATCDKNFIWDFPDGLEAGTYQFDAMWIAPCEVWVGLARDGLIIESCLDDHAPMTNLRRQIELTVNS